MRLPVAVPVPVEESAHDEHAVPTLSVSVVAGGNSVSSITRLSVAVPVEEPSHDEHSFPFPAESPSRSVGVDNKPAFPLCMHTPAAKSTTRMVCITKLSLVFFFTLKYTLLQLRRRCRRSDSASHRIHVLCFTDMSTLLTLAFPQIELA